MAVSAKDLSQRRGKHGPSQVELYRDLKPKAHPDAESKPSTRGISVTASTVTTGKVGVGDSTVAAGPVRFAFERHFIVTTAAIAILLGILVAHRPGLFLPVLLLGLWLLGYTNAIPGSGNYFPEFLPFTTIGGFGAAGVTAARRRIS